jgi:hypothetical protein
MTTTAFDASLRTLLDAFKTHHDLRAQHADLPALARSNHELYKARMAAYHVTR